VLLMAMSAVCPTCSRTVYVASGDTPICPVCSSPLLEQIDAKDPAPEPDVIEVDQMEGTK
jgi:endogenous inhibitor of DNA gyrase (YacG/DUF329 family)